jgi:hypothetical protein
VTRFSPELRAAAFDVAEAALVADMGSVSIVKFLGGETEAEATSNWFRVIEAFLEPLPDGVFLSLDLSAGRPVLRFDASVALDIELFEVHGRPTFDDAWRFRMNPALAPLVLDAVGTARWGREWQLALDSIADEDALPVQEAGETFGWASLVRDEIASAGQAARAQGWVVRAGPHLAPAPWFTDESRARRGGLVVALGSDRVGRLFEHLETGAGLSDEGRA